MFTLNIDQNHLQLALDHVPSYVSIKDRNLRYVYANRAMLEFLGCSAQHLESRTDQDLFSAPAARRLSNIDLQVLAGQRHVEEIGAKNTFGRQSVYWVAKTPLFKDRKKTTVTGILSVITDITVQRQLEEQLAYAAETDILTGLFNRRKLIERLGQAQHRSIRQGTSCCLMRIHVGNFEYLNDTYGYILGDQLIVAVAKELQKQVRANDCLARYGQAEFILLLEDLSPELTLTRQQVNTVTDKLKAVLQKPLCLQNREVDAGLRIEFNLFHGADTSIDNLLYEVSSSSASAPPIH
ncbi:MAG: diguanylate cyclase [Natronospirillum sp.]|uniref:sensor domain-containing diguanylate cyclase n=1 Tax=Natronospirillum sp. TaxID=2812955 RepID=UPI0025F520E7|nr:diguanylate cyclase [Natronospirillum sp.]MCH8552019.1 diguanylate cyclase [Natronospirillum sp.]